MNDDPRKGKPSASSFHRLVHCAGSLGAEAAIIEQSPSSETAQSGTRIHDAVAKNDLDELGIKEEQVADRLAQMNQAALEQWQTDFTVSNPKIIREKRFWIKNLKSGDEIVSGKPDFVAIAGDGLLVIDDKSGFKAVTHAAGNWQLRVLLVALDQAFGPFTRARASIAQHRLGSIFNACDYQRSDIDQAYAEILFYCQRAKNPNAERVPGQHCFYCRAKAVCAEHAAWAMMPMVRAKVLDVPKKGEIELRVAQLPVEALAFIESRRTAANNLFSAVTARLKAMSEEQLAAVGLELKPSGSLRSIPDTIALWQVLVKSGLLTQDEKGAEEFRSLADINITRMDELLVTRLKLKEELSTKDSEIKLRELLAPVTKFTPKSPTLKPIKL